MICDVEKGIIYYYYIFYMLNNNILILSTGEKQLLSLLFLKNSRYKL